MLDGVCCALKNESIFMVYYKMHYSDWMSYVAVIKAYYSSRLMYVILHCLASINRLQLDQ